MHCQRNLRSLDPNSYLSHFFSMFSFRLDKVRAVLIGERELREVWERFPNMWFCASCCFSCNALGENLHISRFAPQLCLPECAAACTIATDGLSTMRAGTSAQRPIRARKPGNYFITGSCGKIPRDLRTKELIAIFTPWHLLFFALFMLAVISLELKCGSVVEICFSTISD